MASHTANSVYLAADGVGGENAIAARSSGQSTFLLQLLLNAMLMGSHRAYGKTPGSGQQILLTFPTLLQMLFAPTSKPAPFSVAAAPQQQGRGTPHS